MTIDRRELLVQGGVTGAAVLVGAAAEASARNVAGAVVEGRHDLAMTASAALG